MTSRVGWLAVTNNQGAARSHTTCSRIACTSMRPGLMSKAQPVKLDRQHMGRAPMVSSISLKPLARR
eukprot:scaffold435153_cov18-Prasinocladus_malaysianus.AAC.1